MAGITPGPAGQKVTIFFNIDKDGILTLRATINDGMDSLPIIDNRRRLAIEQQTTATPKLQDFIQLRKHGDVAIADILDYIADTMNRSRTEFLFYKKIFENQFVLDMHNF